MNKFKTPYEILTEIKSFKSNNSQIKVRFKWKYSWNSYLFLEQKDNRPNEIIEVTDQKRKH